MNKKVLIVEDDKLLCDVYRHSLELEGIGVLTAESYNSAIKIFNPDNISLLVLDIMLKNKNGFELLRDLRKTLNGDTVPTIIVTGMNTQDLNMDKELMVSLNILGIYTKSQFSISQFSKVVKDLIGQSEAV